MPKQTPENRLIRQLSTRTGTNAEDWFLVHKARFGIEVVLRVLGDVRGHGEVITQPFTCVTAVNPIMSAGHIPVYGDISAATLSIDPSNLHASGAARALVMQHSFGILSDTQSCRRFADTHNLLLLEDSAHKLGLMAEGKHGPLADVSVHSFGVEKMLPTKFGGAVWLNPKTLDKELHKRLVTALRSLPVARPASNWRAKTYVPMNRFLAHVPPAAFGSWLRHIVTQLGVFEAPIMPIELRGKNAGIAAKPSTWMVKQVLAALEHYDRDNKQRSTVSRYYHDTLANLPLYTAPKGVHPDDAMTRFPVLCASAEQAETVFAELNKQKLHAGKWYRPTLFPGPVSYNTYNYDPDQYPIAEDVAARIINLRTNVTRTRAKEICDVLRRSTI